MPSKTEFGKAPAVIGGIWESEDPRVKRMRDQLRRNIRIGANFIEDYKAYIAQAEEEGVPIQKADAQFYAEAIHEINVINRNIYRQIEYCLRASAHRATFDAIDPAYPKKSCRPAFFKLHVFDEYD